MHRNQTKKPMSPKPQRSLCQMNMMNSMAGVSTRSKNIMKTKQKGLAVHSSKPSLILTSTADNQMVSCANAQKKKLKDQVGKVTSVKLCNIFGL